jgi:transcriptional regulator with XRE-family HTH domain
MKIDSTAVRRIRHERAWSQEQLASVAGVSLRTIQRVESDGSGSLETNMALASALGVPTIELTFEGQTARPKTSVALIGIVAGASGALGGLALAWLGFFSQTMDTRERGAALGIVGTASGLVIAFLALLARRFFSNKSQGIRGTKYE